MTRLATPAIAVVVAAAAGACAPSDGAPTVERVDSAGIELVTSAALDVPLEWSARERFTLGGEEEGPESFYGLSPRFVGADDASRIHVRDGVSHRVIVFDADGRPVRTLGRQGGGPGELRLPASLGVTPDGSVSVYDQGKRALVLWDSAGRLLPERRFPHHPSLFGGRQHVLTDAGYVVNAGASDEQGRRVNRLIHVADRDTTVLASIHQPNRESPAMFPSCGGGINFPPLFTPHVVWDYRDGMTAVAAGTGYRIDLYRDGQLVRSIRRAIEPVLATRELAVAEAGEGFRIDFGRGPCTVPPDEYADARGWAETVPAIGRVALTPDGALWVQRRVAGEENPPIDVFAGDGAYRGTLPPGTPFPALFFTDGAVGVITTDAMDVDRLSVREPARGAS